jgi:REP element-mobilizing transposase RayT
MCLSQEVAGGRSDHAASDIKELPALPRPDNHGRCCCGAGVPPAECSHAKLPEAGGMPAPQDAPAPQVEFVDPRATPFVPMQSRGELPHLYKEGGSYFVTFRLCDAVVPNAVRIDKKVLHKMSAIEIAAATEPPLRLGSCVLARPEVASIVQDAIRHFHAQRYLLSAWCVMPNHVHIVVTPMVGYEPSDIFHSWKSFTAHRANKFLQVKGTFWERESFDHLIRNVDQFEAFVDYVERNPVAAGLCHSPADWPFSSCSRTIVVQAGRLP